MQNTIYLRRKNKVILPQGKGNSRLRDAYLGAFLKNIESLGYTLSQPLIERVRTLSVGELTVFYEQLIQDLKTMVGAKVKYNPMYPNFPKQVMEASQLELYINAIMHYLTLQLPEYQIQERSPLIDDLKLKIIDLGSQDEFELMFSNLLRSQTSISATDKEDITWFVCEYKDAVAKLIPDQIPMKENIAFLAGLLIKYTQVAEPVLSGHFKTATDVLRLAVALSGGDVSLAQPSRFRTFSRAERRLLLAMLEKSGTITEDMLRFANVWIRLGEKLHPFEYKARFPKTYTAFDIIRNNKPFDTFAAKVEKGLVQKQFAQVAALLVSRPGEFARRLDHLLRNVADGQSIVAQFGEVADQVSTTVLLQVMAHFKNRNKGNALRAFFPKGNVAKVHTIPNTLPFISQKLRYQVLGICEAMLINRFAALKPLGNVYLDEKLQDYLVPFSQRSASKALRTLVRGSSVDLPEGDTIRFFLWWKEGTVKGAATGRVDIDLSAVMYDTNWKYREHISYTNLKSSTYRACHSGDITTAPDGACEFIDLDIPSVVRYGGRYVVMSLNSFSGQQYCNLPECYAGWMMRQHPNSGEIFEPATVQDKVDLSADTRICIPVILDLLARKVIWADLALKKHPVWANNVEGNAKGVALMGQAMTTLAKPTLYDLFLLHATARGTLSDAAEADTVFSLEKGITPFDIETIMAEYM